MKQEGHLFISDPTKLIRIIGDPILHKPGKPFPQKPSLEQQQELADQIEHAKYVLIQTGGAGIAANQCAQIENPYRFTIVGIFHEISDHALAVEKRYPGTIFPQAKIMVNPVVTAVSKETQSFNHACLSVPCANRCAVISPMKISVRYQDYGHEMCLKNEEFIGTDAVVLWHELKHIVDGKTYMDLTFESLPIDDLLQFQKMLSAEISKRQEEHYNHLPNLCVPPFYFSVIINSDGIPSLEPKVLAEVLPDLAEETLHGLLNQANYVIEKSSISRAINNNPTANK